MTYVAYITEIKNVRKHPDAHSLMIGECFGNQVVVGLTTKEDDIGVYFPSDGRLSQEFLKANDLVGYTNEQGVRCGGFFDEKGKVRTQKFRGEKSDGYFCNLDSLVFTGVNTSTLTVGTTFTEINGIKICEKYVTEKTCALRVGKKKITEKIKFPIFYEHPDTEQLAYNAASIKTGQFIVVTEKLHGTSGRTSLSRAVSYSPIALLINGLFKREIIAPTKGWKYVCGSRRVVIKDFGRATGYFKDDEIIRKNAHDKFVGKLHKGETVYYEIVGYLPSGKPIMSPADNGKLDKQFKKTYGKETVFHYGCESGQFEVYVYRISLTNEDGIEVDYTQEEIEHRCSQIGVRAVPTLWKFINWRSGDIMKVAEQYVSGCSMFGLHIKEGVVVRINSSKWKAWKHKSFEFKVLEGIIKDTGVEDIEEGESV